jgi:hypothetical protein
VMRLGFNNRLRMNWKLLLAIADLAGDDWPKSARQAAVKLARDIASRVKANACLQHSAICSRRVDQCRHRPKCKGGSLPIRIVNGRTSGVAARLASGRSPCCSTHTAFIPKLSIRTAAERNAVTRRSGLKRRSGTIS